MVVESVSERLSANEPVVFWHRHRADSSHGSRGAPVLELRRCFTCKLELSAGVDDYCNDVCRLKRGLSKRTPGCTVARRRRRRGGRRR